MSNESQQTAKMRTFTGVVVSDKGNKTIIVKVTRFVMHPKYKRQYRVSRRYAVHDEANTHHEGETVRFVECRPLSKTKRWRVIEEKAV